MIAGAHDKRALHYSVCSYEYVAVDAVRDSSMLNEAGRNTASMMRCRGAREHYSATM